MDGKMAAKKALMWVLAEKKALTHLSKMQNTPQKWSMSNR